ncbi:MAG: SpoIIE family protein phosphatase [Candidatus Sulfotelmatobacter sp.]
MRAIPRLPRPFLVVPATVFALIVILYSALWMYYSRWQYPMEAGVTVEYSPAEHALEVSDVVPNSAAGRAGLRPGDRIIAVNGQPLTTDRPYTATWRNARPGDRVQLTVARTGVPAQFEVTATFRARTPGHTTRTMLRSRALQIIQLLPVPFVAVGLGVLFWRLDDRNAWLLALLFAGFIGLGPLYGDVEGNFLPAFRGFAVAYKTVFFSLFPALFYYFFAVFPEASPLDRRVPWLKTVLIGAACIVAVPVGLWGLVAGTSQPVTDLLARTGEEVDDIVGWGYMLAAPALGLVSLVSNSIAAPSPEARRKSRVLVWTMVVGMVPFLLLQGWARLGDRPTNSLPFWLWASGLLLHALVPLGFAYAVVKHRVLEIPVLLKRSARYLLVQRGSFALILIVCAAATWFLAAAFARHFPAYAGMGLPLGTVFGVLLVLAIAQVQRAVRQRLDRAFFRGSYDARMILQDLAEKARTVSSRHELATLLEQHLNRALHPRSLTGYFETHDGNLSAECGYAPPGMDTITPELPFLAELVRSGQPQEVASSKGVSQDGASSFAALRADCLVPVLGRDSRLVGLLVLGPRLSEEPYSGEDKHLLASVASQTGVALESLRLAEQMAERMEAERRAGYEMEIARKVQSRLFPHVLLQRETLVYAGGCVQASQVGGDYYDFIDLGAGRLGIVLADISGKGISGALLMANLQANLRSQYALAVEDLPRLLKSVNKLFYENTPEECYATLVFAVYDDARRTLRYANCGHNPPLLLRTGGTIDKLESTTTVLGMFEEWECPLAETQILRGDVLVIYTDGITEAVDSHGEEFGVARLIEAVQTGRGLNPQALVGEIFEAVHQFSQGPQADDLTLIAARGV